MQSSFLVNVSTSALVLLWMGLAALGMALLMRKRWAGGLLLVEGVLGAAAHLALSLVPVGIGEPLIRIGKQDLLAWGMAGSIIDPFWGTGFVLVVWTAFALNRHEPPRSLLLAVLTTIWGARLSLFLLCRNWGHGEDRRYQAMRVQHGPRGDFGGQHA